MKIEKLPITDLVKNEGQIEGIPANPRQWTKADVEKIAKSLKETPELFEMRPCLVYEQDGKYIVLGGNLRLEGALKNKEKEVPCIVVPRGTPVSKLKEIVIKDNGSFGKWDFDALANEWDDLPLTEWGVPAWENEEEKSNNDIDLSENINAEYKVEIECMNEAEQQSIYDDFTKRGYKCKILTL